MDGFRWVERSSGNAVGVAGAREGQAAREGEAVGVAGAREGEAVGVASARSDRRAGGNGERGAAGWLVGLGFG
jgi:hypothetical protein